MFSLIQIKNLLYLDVRKYYYRFSKKFKSVVLQTSALSIVQKAIETKT